MPIDPLGQIKKSAIEGDAENQFKLGIIYYEGKDVLQDYKEAAKWITMAANQRLYTAQDFLNNIYNYGLNAGLYEYDIALCTCDYSYFEHWNPGATEEDWGKWCFDYGEILRKGHEYGKLQFNIGLVYLNGKDVPRDCKKALEWWIKAAENEIGRCGYESYEYGYLYRFRESGWEDYEAAMSVEDDIFNRYGEGICDYIVTKFVLGVMYYQGEGFSQDYGEAARWFTEAAQEGLAQAQIMLSFMFEKGQVKIDIVEEYKWCLLALSRGADIHEYEKSLSVQMTPEQIADAKYRIGAMYYCGDGYMDKTDCEAIMWFTEAAEQGNANAQYNLGKIYRYGDGVKQDYQEAFEWFKKATEQGHVGSQFDLGDMIKKIKNAAEYGSVNEQYHLAKMYYNGEWVPQDYVEAYKWYILAAAKGEESSVEFKNILLQKLTLRQKNQAHKLARAFKPKTPTGDEIPF